MNTSTGANPNMGLSVDANVKADVNAKANAILCYDAVPHRAAPRRAAQCHAMESCAVYAVSNSIAFIVMKVVTTIAVMHFHSKRT